MIELFNDSRISDAFAMRGGTALHKLALGQAVRYSEDIDLVQVVPGPIKLFFDALHDRIDPWLGKHSYDLREHSVRVVYRFETETEPVRKMKVKIEANTREHFVLHGLRGVPHRVNSPWFSGEATVPTFELDELLGTKLRALYQRKKGRDLFDLHEAGRRDGVDLDRVVASFTEYVARQGLSVNRAEFDANLTAKLLDKDFRTDIEPLLAPGVEHDAAAASAWVTQELLGRLE
jgi:predicted nucleotidyltransferase component of viral defense system